MMKGQQPALRVIVLRRLPVQLHRRLVCHWDELYRECTWISLSPAEDEGGRAARLIASVDEMRRQFGQFVAGPTDEIIAAAVAAERWRDITFRVPQGAARVSAALQQLLEEADGCCREGGLSSLVTPPQLVVYREWFLGQFIGQLVGAAPVPWGGPWVPIGRT